MSEQPSLTTRELMALAGQVSAWIRRTQRRGRSWLPAASRPRAAASDVLPDDLADLADARAPPGRPTTLAEVRAQLGECTRCRLHEGRRNLVFGVGSPTADVMFIGEAPGYDEDVRGEPFVGKAGQLLTRMIEAMGLTRESVYIANIIKCRPPRNRNPQPDEVQRCEPFLRQQIEVIGPRLIVGLGNFAVQTLLRSTTGITRVRGRWHDYQGIALMPTFHPAYLLRNPEGKRPAWNDLQMVMAEMDRLGLARNRA